MASKKAYVDHLRNVPLFAGCTSKELERIARSGDEIKMTAGSLLVDQGQTGREAFVVLDGTVTVKRNGRKVATLGPGAIVGELSLLDHGPRTATVVCETDCTLFVISQRHFLAVLDDVPTIAHKLLAALAGRIRELDREYYGYRAHGRSSAAAGNASWTAPSIRPVQRPSTNFASAMSAARRDGPPTDTAADDGPASGPTTWPSASASASPCSPWSRASCR